MALPAPTVVLLDMDGTLVRHYDARLLHVLEWLDDATYALRRLWPLRSKGPPRLWAHKMLHRVRRKDVDEIVEPCPGAIDFLRALEARGVPCAVVSNGMGAGYGHEILEAFGLGPYFAATVFREDAPRAKPHPDIFREALERMGRAVGGGDVVWVVGDRAKDVRAALALAPSIAPARVVPVAYDWSAARAVLSRGLGLEHIVMAFPDMLRALGKQKETPA